MGCAKNFLWCSVSQHRIYYAAAQRRQSSFALRECRSPLATMAATGRALDLLSDVTNTASGFRRETTVLQKASTPARPAPVAAFKHNGGSVTDAGVVPAVASAARMVGSTRGPIGGQPTEQAAPSMPPPRRVSFTPGSYGGASGDSGDDYDDAMEGCIPRSVAASTSGIGASQAAQQDRPPMPTEMLHQTARRGLKSSRVGLVASLSEGLGARLTSFLPLFTCRRKRPAPSQSAARRRKLRRGALRRRPPRRWSRSRCTATPTQQLASSGRQLTECRRRRSWSSAWIRPSSSRLLLASVHQRRAPRTRLLRRSSPRWSAAAAAASRRLWRCAQHATCSPVAAVPCSPVAAALAR